jgi:hypothetical protein
MYSDIEATAAPRIRCEIHRWRRQTILDLATLFRKKLQASRHRKGRRMPWAIRPEHARDSSADEFRRPVDRRGSTGKGQNWLPTPFPISPLAAVMSSPSPASAPWGNRKTGYIELLCQGPG